MKQRTKFDESRDQQAAQESQGVMNCRRCEALTAWTTLSLLGGRCSACYARYCTEPMSARVGPDQRAPKRALPRKPGRVNLGAGNIGDAMGRAGFTPAQLPFREGAMPDGRPDPDYRQPDVSDGAQDARP